MSTATAMWAYTVCGAAVGIVLGLLILWLFELLPMMRRHEALARCFYDERYRLENELKVERKSRKEAGEQIMVLSRQVFEADRERRDVSKRLKGQFKENSKLKKALRRKGKPPFINGGRGKSRCLNADCKR